MMITRRDVFGLAAVSSFVLTSAGCSSSPKVPQGWKQMSAGPASFIVPETWQEVEIPEGTALVGWDYAVQDQGPYESQEATCRLLVMSHGAQDLLPEAIRNDAKASADYLASEQLFGGGMALGINNSPQRIDGRPDQLWRLDYRASAGSEDTTPHDYAFVAQDDGKPELAILGLTGPGITEDLVTTFASGIEVVHA